MISDGEQKRRAVARARALRRAYKTPVQLAAAVYWQGTYGHDCPHSVYELTEFMERDETLDPWGRRYWVRCANRRVFVLSIGEDGIPNTADDIRSWD